MYQIGSQYIVEVGDSAYQTGSIFIQETSLLELSEAQNLIFEQETDLIASLQPEAEQDLIFEHEAETINVLSLMLESELIFIHIPPVPGYTKPAEATQSLIFTDACFTTSPNAIEAESESSFTLTHSALSSIKMLSSSSNLIFTDSAVKVKITAGVDAEAESELIFTDVASKVKILAGAVAADSEDELIFNSRASLPVFLNAFSNFSFSHSATAERLNFIEQELIFTDDVSIAGTVWLRSIESDLLFTQHFIYETNTPDTCHYAPNVGSVTFPSEPTLVRQSFVTLFHPVISPTTTLQIRAPEFGDRDTLQHDRINRETRGGTLRVFADDTWPRLQVLRMQFTGLKESEAQSLLTFFRNTLGLEVGFTDWENRTWHGVITAPDAELVRTKRNNVDVSLEFEGELQ